MKQTGYKKYLVYAGISVATMLIIAGGLFAQSTLQWEGILPDIFTGTSGTEAINIAMTQSTVGLDISEETALTNTRHPIVDLTHRTTGTPANGIGEGIRFTQEVTSGDEIAGLFNIFAEDITEDEEDFGFEWLLMKAGAAATQAMNLTSTGVLTLVNDATLDNTTNGTVIITEPTISLQGAIDTKVCTLGDGDATPSVAGCTVLETQANTSALEITDLDDPVVGAIYIIVGTSATNSTTIQDTGNFKLSGSTFTAGVDETLILYCQADNDYIELSRSTN